MPKVTHRPAPPTLSEADAAEYIGVAPATARNWRSMCQGPPYIQVGRRIRYRLADLDAWLDAHRVDPEAS